MKPLCTLRPDRLLPDALATYQKITGAVSDSSTGLLKITAAQFDSLESLFFNVGGVSPAYHAITDLAGINFFLQQSYEITPNAQIWPRAVRHRGIA